MLALLTTASASAHFKLLKPASWITESALGDPQKMSPCGTAANDTRTAKTNVVTTFRAGETITLEGGDAGEASSGDGCSVAHEQGPSRSALAFGSLSLLALALRRIRRQR